MSKRIRHPFAIIAAIAAALFLVALLAPVANAPITAAPFASPFDPLAPMAYMPVILCAGCATLTPTATERPTPEPPTPTHTPRPTP